MMNINNGDDKAQRLEPSNFKQAADPTKYLASLEGKDMKKVEVPTGSASTPIRSLVETEKLLPQSAKIQQKVETKGFFNAAYLNLFLLLAIGSCK